MPGALDVQRREERAERKGERASFLGRGLRKIASSVRKRNAPSFNVLEQARGREDRDLSVSIDFFFPTLRPQTHPMNL